LLLILNQLNAIRLSHLFLANTRDLNHFKRFPEVILIDATYKMNQHRLPLVHILGQTCLNTTFEIGYTWIKNEAEMDYNWVIRQFMKHAKRHGVKGIKVILTDKQSALYNACNRYTPGAAVILCRWHVYKAIAKKKKGIPSAQ